MKQKAGILHSLAILGVLGATLLFAPASSGDDRQLFLNNSEDPYLFMLMDTSGSMSFGLEKGWINDYEQTAVPGGLDDPGSRLYQAKSAIYEVVSSLPRNANIGFGHFAQPDNKVLKKHHLYTRPEGTANPSWYDQLPFPAPGQPLRFGDWQWGVQNGRPSELYGFQFWTTVAGQLVPWYGCSPGFRDTIWSWMGAGIGPLPPASDFESAEAFQQHRLDRLGFFAKGGPNGNVRTHHITEYAGKGFQVVFEPISAGHLGGPQITVEVVINECIYVPEASGSRRWQVGPEIGRHTFELVPLYTEDREGIPFHGAFDFISPGYDVLAFANERGFSSGNPCGGWDPNVEDGSGAEAADSQIYYPTVADPLARVDPDTGNAYPSAAESPFSRGDLIPWDWIDHSSASPPPAGYEYTNRDEFLRRLAPNVFSSGVSLYQGRSQTGPAQAFSEDIPDLTGTTVGVAQASSVSIVPGCTAELYSGINYSGNLTVVTDDDPWLGDDAVGDDAVSSLRVSCPPEGPDNRTPDFRVANYFADRAYNDGTAPLYSHLHTRPEYADNPPILAQGSTPLAATMTDFRDWLVEWKKTATDENVGDPDWECRRRFAILLTDGWETCQTSSSASDPETDPSAVPIGPVANAAAAIFDEGVQVFVLGFAPSSGSDPARMTAMAASLQAAADAGGTGRLSKVNPDGQDCELLTYVDDNGQQQNLCPGPAIATDREALVRALRNILSAIDVAPTSLAGAGLPTDRSDRDSIFLSDFTPLEATTSWPGRIKHFVNPIPLDAGGAPDASRTCSTDPDVTPRECFAWDAGQAMLGNGPLGYDQAPTADDLATVTAPDLGDLRLGLGVQQRRVFFSLPLVGSDDLPMEKDWLYPWDGNSPTLKRRKYSLWDGLGLTYTVGDNGSESAAHLRAVDILKHTYAIKTGEHPEEGPIEWILGDVFHSTPAVIGAPSNFLYNLVDLEGNSSDCFDANGNLLTSAKGYSCFRQKNLYRRRVLFTGTNDGLVHAFDAGSWEYRTNGSVVQEGPVQNLGSGQELFAYAPRGAMPQLRLQEEGQDRATGEWGVDGPIEVGDVFIDPVHTGTPTATDRQWRTIALGGLREGGRSYYALDVTQPERVTSAEWATGGAVVVPTDGDTSNPSRSVPSASNYLPSCVTSYDAANCGPLPWPSVLWEFDADDLPTAADAGTATDPDLGDTWSTPVIGRIRVSLPGSGNKTSLGVRYVAFVGGGLDPGDATVGNWLYMVDIETGFPIYARELDGAVPAEVAAVDTNQDNVVDTVYVPTVAGTLYKVDLSAPVLLENVSTTSGWPGGRAIRDVAWDPYPIFHTGGRPIFYPPSVVFLARTGQFAVAFGTGNREDLWSSGTPADGRFFVFRDPDLGPTDPPSGGFDESHLGANITADDTTQYGDLLLAAASPNSLPGYSFQLAADERLVDRARTVGGVTGFLTFNPESVQANGVCENSGSTNVYTFFIRNSNGLVSTGARYRTISGFAGSLFASTTSGAAAERDEDEDGNPDNGGSGANTEDLDTDMLAIMQSLKEQMPDECRFNDSLRIDFRLLHSDTHVELVAPIPVCQISDDWKDL